MTRSAMRVRTPIFFVCNLMIPFLIALLYLSVTDLAGLYVVSDLGGSGKISVYSLVFYGIGVCLGLPLANAFADRFGTVRVYVFFLYFFSAASVLCGVSPTFFILNIFRLFLGFASSFFLVLTRRLLWHYLKPVPREICNFLMLLYHIVGPVIGACIGAVFAYFISWRLAFFVEIPFLIWVACYLWIFYKDKMGPVKNPEYFDWLGYSLYAVTVASFVAGAAMSQYLDWFTSNTFTILVSVGVIGAICFYIHDILHPNPLLELKLVGAPLLFYTFFSFTFLYSGYYGMISLVMIWLKLFTTFTPYIITVLMFLEAASAIVALFLNYYLLKKLDVRITLMIGIVSMLVSCYMGILFSVETDFFHVAVARIFSGFGIVFFLYALCICSVASHPAEKGMRIFVQLQIIRNITTVLGVACYFIMWERREAFYYERLGEAYTVNNPLFLGLLERGQKQFNLTPDQSLAEAKKFLVNASTSLGLNDVFGFMIYVLSGVFVLLLLSFFIRKKVVKA